MKATHILITSAVLTLGEVALVGPDGPDAARGGAAWAQDGAQDGDDNGGGSDDGGGAARGGNGGGSDDGPRRLRRQVVPAVTVAPPPVAAAREIVVADLSAEALDRALAEGFSVLREDRLAALGQTLTRLQSPDGLSLEAARDRVRLLPGGEDADLNHYYRPETGEAGQAEACGHENCAEFGLIGWPADGACQVSVPIGMIDTGVNAQHDILASARLEVMRIADPASQAATAVHGTAVSSLLVGGVDSRVPGLLPGAEVVAVDAFTRDAGDERADVATLLVGLDLLVGRGIRVVNLSLAGPGNAVLAGVLDALAKQDRVVIVAAAGNGGAAAPAAWPAAHPGVIAVTAVDARGRAYRLAQRGPHLDLAAPGVDLLAATSVRGARGKSGTSYAVPFVTAAAAVVLSQEPALGAGAVGARLKAGARDLGAPGPDEIFGAGLLDASGLCGLGPDAGNPVAE